MARLHRAKGHTLDLIPATYPEPTGLTPLLTHTVRCENRDLAPALGALPPLASKGPRPASGSTHKVQCLATGARRHGCVTWSILVVPCIRPR